MNMMNRLKRLQYRNLILLVCMVFAIAAVLYIGLKKQSEKTETIKKEGAQEIVFEPPISHINVKSLWFDRAEKKLEDNVNKTEALDKEIEALQARENERQFERSDDLNQHDHLNQLQQNIGLLNDKIRQLQERLTQADNQGSTTAETSPMIQGMHVKGSVSSGRLTAPPSSDEFSPPNEERLISKSPMVSETLIKKTVNRYVPSGSFVEAILLGGVDVSAAAMSQVNPSPVLLRVVGRAVLPNHHHVDLKDCLMTAAAIGDISSESAYLRLERLSCMFKKDEIIDQLVEGTVFGPAGKNGVRGHPVWREGHFTEQAFLAGTLSGLSEAVSDYYGSRTFPTFSQTTQLHNQGYRQIASYSSSQGIGKALDRLADYHIKRAEQYHPIIQLSAGTRVDVVFLKGFELKPRQEKMNEVSAHFDSFYSQSAPSGAEQPESKSESLNALFQHPSRFGQHESGPHEGENPEGVFHD